MSSSALFRIAKTFLLQRQGKHREVGDLLENTDVHTVFEYLEGADKVLCSSKFQLEFVTSLLDQAVNLKKHEDVFGFQKSQIEAHEQSHTVEPLQ